MSRLSDVREAFEEKGWRPVSLEQRGPDGTEILMLLIFYVCPVCSATIAPGPEDNESVMAEEHREWHLSQARDLDQASTPWGG